MSFASNGILSVDDHSAQRGDTTSDPILATAQAAYRAQVTTIPVKEDGSKAPDVSSWAQYQTDRPTPEQMRAWFANGSSRMGIGVVMGPGGLQGIDFDDRAIFARFVQRCTEVGLSEVIARVCRGYAERTPNGFHIFFYCNAIEGNAKLAQRPKRPEEMEHPNDRVKAMIETRGRGGYFVVAPSHGTVHASGRPYEVVQGSLDRIKTIAEDERAALFDVARSLDEMPVQQARPEPRPTTAADQDRPGDAFNARAEWAEILEPHGWALVFTRGDEEYWRRPGKRHGISATTNYQSSDYLYVFSSSVPEFETERGYSKFSAYAILNHEGDFATAAKALGAQGYGETLEKRTQNTQNSHSADSAYGFLGLEIETGPESDPWEDPTPIQDEAPPPLPVDSFPDWGREYVVAVAASTQTPTDLATLQYVAALSTALQKKIEVRIATDYTEPVNTFNMTILASGTRKSAVVQAMARPIGEYEKALRHDAQDAIDERESERRIAESRLKQIEARAAKEADADLRGAAEEEARAAAHELAAIDVPASPRLLAEDCTPEGMVKLLAAHGGAMSVHAAEATIFEIASGRYTSGKPNLEVFLHAHAAEDIRVDRSGRESQYVEAAALTLGVGTQPDVLTSAGEHRELRGRGLLARFAWAYPASPLGHRASAAPSVPATVRARYDSRLTTLLDLQPGTDGDGNPAPHALTLSADADSIRIAFNTSLEPRLGPAGDLGHISDWASKLTGLVCRYAGLLHMAERVGDPAPWGTPVSPETMAKATALGVALIPHALRVFDELQVDSVTTDARFLLDKILVWINADGDPIAQFSRRNLHEKVRRVVKTPEHMKAALRVLVEHGYLRSVAPPPGPGRKPDLYDVNPQALENRTQNPQNPLRGVPNDDSADSAYAFVGLGVSDGLIEDEGEVVA